MLKNIAKNIPNVLTILRFLLIIPIIYFIWTKKYILAFIFLTISGLTDVLDGFIARKFNFITDFGKLMDPLADKATQLSVLLSLALRRIIPTWISIIVFVKEIAMVAGASFLYGKKLVVSSRWYGKLATVLFYVAIVCSLFVEYWNTTINPGNPIFNFATYIYYFAVIATIFSLIMYFKKFYKDGYLKKDKDEKKVI